MIALETRVCGIPCQVQVDCFNIVEGNPNTWDSDWDYYGYEEIEFTILTTKGKRADWLKRKAENTAGEIDRITQFIKDAMQQRNEP